MFNIEQILKVIFSINNLSKTTLNLLIGCFFLFSNFTKAQTCTISYNNSTPSISGMNWTGCACAAALASGGTVNCSLNITGVGNGQTPIFNKSYLINGGITITGTGNPNVQVGVNSTNFANMTVNGNFLLPTNNQELIITQNSSLLITNGILALTGGGGNVELSGTGTITAGSGGSINTGGATCPSSSSCPIIVGSCTGTLCTSGSNCSPAPTFTSTTTGNRCGTGTVTLGATASTGTLYWYNVSTGGTSLGTGNTFTTPSISVTTVFFAGISNCNNVPRLRVTASVSGSSVGGTPNIISSSTSVCRLGTANYTVTGITNATTFNWTVPSGFSITSGVGTSVIGVSFLGSAFSSNISISGSNSCSSGSVSSVPISVNPSATVPGSISGTTTLCQSQTGVTYNVTSVPGYTYRWWTPAGIVTTSGANSNAVTLSITGSASSGTISVTGTNSCGTSAATTQLISVYTDGNWLGNTPDWNNTTNWCGGVIPTISTNVTITAGVLNMPQISVTGFVNSLLISPTASLSITGSNILNIGGDFTNNGSFSSSTLSSVNFNSASTQTISGTSTFHNFTLTKTSTSAPVRLVSPQTVRGTLTLSTNAMLITSNSGIMLTLASNSLTGTARIAAIPATSTIVGNVNVQRYIPAKRAFRFLTSPIANASFATWQADMYITSIGSGSDASPSPLPSISNYSEPFAGGQNAGFFAITSGTNTTLPTGLGYRVLVYGNRSQSLAATTSNPTPVTLNQNGFINSGNINIPISYTSTTGGNITVDGWNLVGNPYPSQIDWDLLSISGSSTNLDNAYYAYDTRSDNKTLVGSYFNYVNGVATGSRASLAERPNPAIIGSSQGFFVKANAGNPTLSFTENMKSGLTPTDNFRKEPISNLLYITMQNGSLDDNTAIRFASEATNNFDGRFDAYKLANSNINISSLADDGTNLSINSLPELYNQAKTIPLVVQASRIGAYSLQFSNLASFRSSADLYLNDKLLNTSTKVSEGMTYDFNISSVTGTSGNARFSISFVPQVGSITANLSPKDSITSALWSIDNSTWLNSGDTLKNIPVGNYNITFSTISGWVAPADVAAIVSSNAVSSIAASYTPIPKKGALAVILTPSSIDRGRIKTQWRINNGAWNNSGIAPDSLEVGVYEISFSDLTGYNKPANISVNIFAHQLTTLAGLYTKIDATNPDSNVVVVPVPVDTALLNNISEITTEGKIEVGAYPNPIGNDGFTLYMKNVNIGNYRIEIFDQTGKIISRKTYFVSNKNTKLTINELNDCSNGIYLLRISNSEQNYLLKLIK